MFIKFPSPVYSPAEPAVAAPEPAVEPEPADPSLITDPEPEPADPPADPSLVSDPDPKDPSAADPAPEPLIIDNITLPEGVTIADEAMTEFLDVMNDTELSVADRAQKLVDLQLGQSALAEEAQQEAWTGVQNEWREAAVALPEIGGDKLPSTLADIKSGLDKLGADKETYAALDLTGAGNHPAIIKILHAATAHLTEGRPTPDGRPAGGNLTQAERMFPQ